MQWSLFAVPTCAWYTLESHFDLLDSPVHVHVTMTMYECGFTSECVNCSHRRIILVSNQYFFQAWHHHFAPKHELGQWRGIIGAAGVYFVKGEAVCVCTERWDAKSRLWRECIPLTIPNTPTGWEIEEQLWPSADLWNACTGQRRWLVLTCHSMIICVLEHVWQGDMCSCLYGCVTDWLSALLNYRVCLLFSRSAEEVMPQSMSQPSCIIAPLCHCQGLGTATSDCFSLFPPFPFPCLYFALSPSVFILIRVINLSCRDRLSKIDKEGAYWVYWRQTEPSKALCERLLL